jgi:hypothetical protein
MSSIQTDVLLLHGRQLLLIDCIGRLGCNRNSTKGFVYYYGIIALIITGEIVFDSPVLISHFGLQTQ